MVVDSHGHGLADPAVDRHVHGLPHGHDHDFVVLHYLLDRHDRVELYDLIVHVDRDDLHDLYDRQDRFYDPVEHQSVLLAPSHYGT